MQHLRTQIYLDPSQHAALLREARRLGLSLAAMIRRLVDEHFTRRRDAEPAAQGRRTAALSLIGLGSSGLADVSERTDRYLAEAIRAATVSEPGRPYKKAPRRKPPAR